MPRLAIESRLSLVGMLILAVACGDRGGSFSEVITATEPAPLADPSALQRIASCNAPAGEVFAPPPPPDAAQCPDYDPYRQAYFGDTHVHTAWSFDAYAQIPDRDPDWALRFARGEDPDGSGERLRLPLDFVMIADHSELVGEVNICTDPEFNPQAYNSPECLAFRNELTGDVESPLPFEFGELLLAFGLGQPVVDRLPFCVYADCEGAAQHFWEEQVRLNNAHYEACRFTSLHGYEWTYSPNAAQAHRNIMFENNKVVPRPISYFDAKSASELVRKLDAACREEDSCRYLSMPHNSNISRGRQFFLDPLRLDEPLYAANLGDVARANKVAEIIQEKGSSECRLGLGTNDEQCDFELLRASRPLCCDPLQGVTEHCVSRFEDPNCTAPCPGNRPSDLAIETDNNSGCQATHDFLRNAYKSALTAQQRLGFNPLKLSIIGSTDTHRASAGATDESFGLTRRGKGLASNFGGLAGVWAEENTRESIFAAFSRRETFGTSGPRIKLRLWAGSFPPNMCARPPDELRRLAYENGVPMGQDLAPAMIDAAPEFVIQAQMDEVPLDRLQIIKVWVDAAGGEHERVFELDADPGPGAVVDAQCRVQILDPRDDNPQLCAQWRDPEFDPALNATYYARVLEEKTCRWSTRACVDLRQDPDFCVQNPADNCCPGNALAEPQIIQERAWSSPVWYASVCGEPVDTSVPFNPGLPSPLEP